MLLLSIKEYDVREENLCDSPGSHFTVLSSLSKSYCESGYPSLSSQEVKLKAGMVLLE